MLSSRIDKLTEKLDKSEQKLGLVSETLKRSAKRLSNLASDIKKEEKNAAVLMLKVEKAIGKNELVILKKKDTKKVSRTIKKTQINAVSINLRKRRLITNL